MQDFKIRCRILKYGEDFKIWCRIFKILQRIMAAKSLRLLSSRMKLDTIMASFAFSVNEIVRWYHSTVFRLKIRQFPMVKRSKVKVLSASGRCGALNRSRFSYHHLLPRTLINLLDTECNKQNSIYVKIGLQT